MADPGSDANPQSNRLDQGGLVYLEPLARDHVTELRAAGEDAAVWQFLLIAGTYKRDGMQGVVEELLERTREGSEWPFAIIHRHDATPIGIIRLIDLHEHAAEVATWVSPTHWGTGVNAEAKYLLLRYAFERRTLKRIEFKIDVNNVRSIRAIEKLGARKHHELPGHVTLHDGRRRTSAVYRILNEEWPSVRERLLERRPTRAHGSDEHDVPGSRE